MIKKLICLMLTVAMAMAAVFVYADLEEAEIPPLKSINAQDIRDFPDIQIINTTGHGLEVSGGNHILQGIQALPDIPIVNTTGQGLESSIDLVNNQETEVVGQTVTLQSPKSRDLSNVANWRDFEAAVKDSKVTEINLNGNNIVFDTTLSATRTSNLKIYGGALSSSNIESKGFTINLQGITLTLENVTIVGSYVPGKAGYGTTAILANSLVINNCTLRNMFGGSNGSIIYYSDSLTMTNTNILDCTTSGLGILSLGGTANISNCKIYNNYFSKIKSGQISVVNIENLSASSKRYTVNLTDVKIYNNYSIADNGGVGPAVKVGTNASANFTRCEIYNHNMGNVKGGGMYLAAGGSVTIDNCDIYDNSATYGGGIFAEFAAFSSRMTLQIKNKTKIRRNTAKEQNGGGGGIYTDNLSLLKTDDVTFSENDADKKYVWDYNPNGTDDTNATHKNNIKNTTYTEPFNNAYNNADINYTDGVEYNPVTVSFNSQGGSAVSSISVNTALKYGALQTPTRTGYKFDGWYTAATGGTLVKSDTVVTNSASHTLYARWSLLTYTVSFNSQGGSAASNQTVTHGKTYGTLPTVTRTGYTFTGWYTASTGGSKVENNSAVSNSNHTLYARWSSNPYTVSFNSMGGTEVSNQTIYHDGTYKTLPVTTRTGYAFIGWHTAATGGVKVESDKAVNNSNHTLYARWSPNPYTLYFDSQGGIEVASQTIYHDGTYGNLPVATRIGYTFSGWYTASSGSEKVENATDVINSDHVLYAEWSPNPYTISFDSQGGTEALSQTIYHDGIYGSLPDTARTGYTFTGWYTASTGGTMAENNTEVNNSNHTLYAQWSPNPYTVSFNSLGGMEVSNQTVYHDGAYKTLPETTRTGYTFTGWHTAATGGTKIEPDTAVNCSNHALYAGWSPNPYTLHFDSQGGDEVTGQTIYHDGTYGDLPVTTRVGYTFAGWYTASSDGEKVESATAVINSDHVLYAEWSPNPYTISFDSQGGTEALSQTIYHDGIYGSLPDTARTGYSFIGWYTAVMGGTKIESDTAVNCSNHTLYARWSPNPYTLHFDSQGGVEVTSQTIYHDGTYGDLPVTTRVGYTFAGWYMASSDGEKAESATDVINSDHVLYAEWSPNPYTISFDSQGGTEALSQTIYHDGIYESLPDTARTGYSFIGWYTAVMGGTKVEIDTAVNCSNHTLYARWSPNPYTLHFDSQGGVEVTSQTIYHDGTYGDLPVTTRVGYTFAGWYTASSDGEKVESATDVINSDHVLYAEWLPNPYTISFDSQGGTGALSQTIYHDGIYGSLPDTARTGYSFTGWYTASTGGTMVENNAEVNNSSHTLYAQWSPSPYTVSFNSMGGTEVSNQTVYHDGTYKVLPVTARAGYTFTGWHTAATGGTKIETDTAVNCSNHTLYAGWSPNPYTLYFDSQGGIEVTSQIIYHDGTYGELPVTTRVGYTFAGWYTASSDGEKVESATDVINSDHVLYAEWLPNPYTISFDSQGGTEALSQTIYHDGIYGSLPDTARTGYSFTGWYTASMGGTEVSNQTVFHDGTYKMLPETTRMGYTFTGWYTSATGGAKVESDTAVNCINHTLYAGWSPNPYTLYFDSQGGVEVASQTIYHDGTYGDLPVTTRVGYTFVGWYTASSDGEKVESATAVINSDHVLYAEWSPNPYAISFDSQGGTEALSQTIYHDGIYGSLPETTRTGYTFIGWYAARVGGVKLEVTTPVINGPHTLFAQWSANHYTVTFNSRGGTSVSSKAVIFDSPYGTLPVPEREGYIFQGWFSDSSDGIKIESEMTVSALEDHILYAQWIGIPVLVSFYSNGGNLITNKTVEFGAPYKKLDTPLKKGYTFLGWANSHYDGYVDHDTTVDIMETHILKAEWRVNQYTVGFDTGEADSAAPIPKTVTYDAPYGLLTNDLAKEGWVFKGWFLDTEYITEITPDTNVQTDRDHILYARWVVARNISFYYNDGTPEKYRQAIVGSGDMLAEPLEPVRTGYVFSGWQLENSSGYDFSEVVTASFDLYACWIWDGVTPLHEVTFYRNDGSLLTHTSLTSGHGDMIYRPVEPIREGYDFLSWFIDEDCNTEFYFETQRITSNLLLYAKWRRNTPDKYINVKFYWGDGSFREYTTIEVKAGCPVIEPLLPTRAGYEFLGWHTDRDIMTKWIFDSPITNEISLYAGWGRIMNDSDYCTVTFQYNDDTFRTFTTVDVLAGDLVPQPESPTRIGLNFNGWHYDAECTEAFNFNKPVTTDLTSYANWGLQADVTYHSVNCYHNDGSFQIYTSLLVSDGETVILPVEPERSGYVFIGWHHEADGISLFDETSPVYKSMNIYAKWQRDSMVDTYYDIDFYYNDGSFKKYTSIEVRAGNTVRSPVEPLRAGYIFGGWFTDIECGKAFDFDVPVMASQSLYAKWLEQDGNSYHNVKFQWNDGSYRLYTAIRVASSAEAMEPANPERFGFSFTGWYYDENCNRPFDFSSVITDNLDLYAGWGVLPETEYHTVYFMLNDGTFKQYTAISIAEHGTVPRPADPVREGYVSAGWYYDTNCETEYDFSHEISESFTLYSAWSRGHEVSKYHVVTFLYNDNTFREYTRVEVFNGSSIGNLMEPIRAGYIFIGWYMDKERILMYSLSNPIYESMVVCAGWEKIGEENNYYKARFYYNDGSFWPYTITEMLIGECVSVPVDPVRPGYIFTGWFFDKELIVQYDFSAKEYADLSLYAGWEREYTSNDENGGNPAFDYHNVYFHLNDGTYQMYTVIEVWNKDTARRPVSPVLNGFQFGGWFIGQNSEEEFDFNSPILKETHLYAKWFEIESNVYINVVFQFNDGSFLPYGKVRIPVNQCLNEPVSPRRKGFDFIGWYRDSGCDSLFDFSCALTGDTTLYAGWKETHSESGSNPNTDIPYYDVSYYYGYIPNKPYRKKTLSKSIIA